MDDDARACYDRIVTSLSSTECRRWGISHNTATFTNSFIEQQKFHIRSAYGVSENFYSYSKEKPIQGSGQGVSWAGPRWTCTSNTICSIMDKTNTGMHFADPTNTIEVRKTSDLFVDDTATGVSSNQIKDGRSALEHLQEDEQKHAFLLYSTGHLLALYKCMFYAIQQYFILLVDFTHITW